MKGAVILKSIVQRKDTLLGFIMLLVFGIIFYFSDTIRIIPISVDIGPRFFPRLVSILGGVLSILVILNDQLFSRKKRQDATGDSEQKDSEGMRKMRDSFISLGLVILYMVILEEIGFMLTSGIFILLQAYLLASDEQRKNKLSLIVILCISIVIPIAVFFAFRYGLHLMLPTGYLFY